MKHKRRSRRRCLCSHDFSVHHSLTGKCAICECGVFKQKGRVPNRFLKLPRRTPIESQKVRIGG